MTVIGKVQAQKRALLDAGVHAVEFAHGAEYGGDDILIAHGRVDHHVVERAGRPIGAEVVFDEFDALPVDIIHQFFRFFVALADLSQSANLFGAGSVEENMESIGTLPQEIRGASSDENT